jgi:NADH:ubiquinone oxidoreductase subunit F (NADH-binding)/NADH:ubiquinone oxidoreductase subunit E
MTADDFSYNFDKVPVERDLLERHPLLKYETSGVIRSTQKLRQLARRVPMLVRELRAIQNRCGYLPRNELVELSTRTGTPLHRLHEVATFFPHFRLEPPPPVEVLVCRDLACHLRGAAELTERLCSVAAEFGGGRITVHQVSCLGRCDMAPVALVELHRSNHPTHARILRSPHRGDPETHLRELIKLDESGADLPAEELDRSSRHWRIDPYAELREGQGAGAAKQRSAGSWPPYRAARSFAGRLNAATSPDERKAAANELIDALRIAELRGMGGAGVPAFQKWKDVRDAKGEPKYIVCNADESEPATFKDRELLLRVPDLIIEGMVLAALLTGASQGYIYIRHEYYQQVDILNEALEEARGLGVIGPNVLDSGRTFELEVFESPGGYVCGEQGALIEAIEERRAEPRNRPPQIETNGLFDKPTLLSNVETFTWVPAILLHGGSWYARAGRKGGAWYAKKGKNGAKGLRFFSLCGDISRPGVYEVEIGSTLGELIQLAGGVCGGLPLLAVATSGPSGGFVPAVLTKDDIPPEFRRGFPADRETLDVCELPLDLDEFRSLGLMLGAGLVVYAQAPGSNMLDHALNATRFFRNESCGKCVPCRIGSEKLVKLGEQLALNPRGAEVSRAKSIVNELLKTLELTSICGLGMSAAKPLASVLQSFEKDLATQ